MRRYLVIGGILAVVALLSGCTSMANSAPGADLHLREMKTSDTYHIIGPTTGTSTGGYLFGFIPVGMERKSGQVAFGTFPVGGINPVVRAAVYNAIDAIPEADALIVPRWESLKKNYIVYSELTVTVKGKAIRYGK